MDKTWEDANKRCNSYGSQLLTIQDANIESELQAISLALNKSIWIGYKYDSNEWQWTDQSNSKYTNWATNIQNHKECAVLSNNGWYSTTCDELHYFVCGDNIETKMIDIGDITLRTNSTDITNLENQSVSYCQATLMDTNMVNGQSTIDLHIKCNMPGMEGQNVYLLQDNTATAESDIDWWLFEWFIIICVCFGIVICCICCYSFNRLTQNKSIDTATGNPYHGYTTPRPETERKPKQAPKQKPPKQKPPIPEFKGVESESNVVGVDANMVIAEFRPLPPNDLNQLQQINENMEDNAEEKSIDISTDSGAISDDMYDPEKGHQRVATTDSMPTNGQRLHAD